MLLLPCFKGNLVAQLFVLKGVSLVHYCLAYQAHFLIKGCTPGLLLKQVKSNSVLAYWRVDLLSGLHWKPQTTQATNQFKSPSYLGSIFFCQKINFFIIFPINTSTLTMQVHFKGQKIDKEILAIEDRNFTSPCVWVFFTRKKNTLLGCMNLEFIKN